MCWVRTVAAFAWADSWTKNEHHGLWLQDSLVRVLEDAITCAYAAGFVGMQHGGEDICCNRTAVELAVLYSLAWCWHASSLLWLHAGLSRSLPAKTALVADPRACTDPHTLVIFTCSWKDSRSGCSGRPQVAVGPSGARVTLKVMYSEHIVHQQL